MPKYICKVHKNGKQLRFAIPSDVVQDMKWDDARFVVLQVHPNKKLELRSFEYADTVEEQH